MAVAKLYIKRGDNLPSTVNRGGVPGGCVYVNERSTNAPDLAFPASDGFPTTALYANTGVLVMRRVRNTGAAWIKGTVVMKPTGGDYAACVLSTGVMPAQRIAGIAVRPVATNEYDYVVKEGAFVVVADAAFSAGDPLISAAGGKAKTMTAGNEHCVFASALEDAGGADEVKKAYIYAPG